MHQHTESINSSNNLAPRFSISENVARSMSSQEIADLVGSRHDSVKRAIERLALKGVIDTPPMVEKPTGGRPVEEYVFSGEKGKRDSLVVVAQLSPEFTGALVDRWQELEAGSGKVIATLPNFADPVAAARAWADQVEQKNLLSVEVQVQANKIHSLENLFKEGMTHTQFCKGLNGVNVMQVGNYLEARSWLYNESKSGTRHRVGSYARDKYMTEHQVEVTPHGKDPFISYTPVLLKKGAARLYDLYLAGELPMKKTWDGLFTHDKALRAE